MKKQTLLIISLIILFILSAALLSYLFIKGTEITKVEGKIVFESNRNDPQRLPNICVLKDGKIFLLAGGIDPCWSPDGKKIIYMVGSSEPIPGIYIINEDGTDKRLIFKEEEDALVWYPTFSPDGKKVVFISDRGAPYSDVGAYLNIFVVDIDGENFRNITNFKERRELYSVAYSPDGKKLIFTIRDPKTELDHIATINIDSSDMREITKGFSAKYSPNGKQIVFSDFAERRIPKIFIMNSDGTNKRQLTFGEWRDIQPVFSPDGKKICYASYRHSDMPWESELFVINTDGTGEARITPPAFIPGTTKFVTDSGPDWHE